MYLVGAAHPLKLAAQSALERLAVVGEALVADAEVFQEILHRYAALGRKKAVADAWAVLDAVLDEVFPVELVDVERARGLLETTQGLSARDCLHWAIMQRRGISRILTFDTAFAGLPGVQQLR